MITIEKSNVDEFIAKKGYASGTRKIVKAIFDRIKVMEKEYEKNFTAFNEEELKEVLLAMEAPTLRALQNDISYIRQYLQYRMESGKTDLKKNPMDSFRTRKAIQPYLTKQKRIFSKKEIYDMAKNAPNKQDGIILLLLFEGVSYKDELEELSNLKRGMIKKDKIQLENREFPISEEVFHYIIKTHEQEYYKSIKGDKERNYLLTKSDYILKGVRKKVQAKFQLIQQRIQRMSSYYGLEHLNGINISYSGQNHYAKKLLEKGFSMDEAVDRIIERYDMTKNESTRYYLKNRIKEK